MSSLLINEIFYSIQGEGKWMGLPNIFIRTTGCNLRCSYCDTTYAYKNGEEKSLEEILEEISKFYCKKICVTGGEPLIQDNISELFTLLIDNGYLLCLETNGSKSVEPYLEYKNLFFSLDIKCPSSEMHENIYLSNLKMLRPIDQIKCIIGDRKDYEYAKQILSDNNISCNVFFQPIWGFSLQTISNWVLEDNLPYYVGIQLHKYIWGCTTGK
ncbi:hypothetical protein B6U98_02635 [Thermoplasmatales archaeon ex4572_165]|nr:MAG: hypothetical protein B6U98_02635 [Thermoplasmatales archaeon ex4572_165]RLF60170.1 MAG: hypothetical protein DRN27_00390 [Thermoplasmata archaeon]